ncbi:MAG: hypothetical protein U1A78_17520 [Polyangia bacterium]
MHDVILVGEREDREQLVEDAGDAGRWQLWLVGADVAGQGRAADVLHDQEQVARVLAEVVHGDDAGVGQAAQRQGLAAEALTEDGAAGPLGKQELDGDVDAEREVAGAVHGAAAAGAQELLDAVALPKDRAEAQIAAAGRHGAGPGLADDGAGQRVAERIRRGRGRPRVRRQRREQLGRRRALLGQRDGVGILHRTS